MARRRNGEAAHHAADDPGKLTGISEVPGGWQRQQEARSSLGGTDLWRTAECDSAEGLMGCAAAAVVVDTVTVSPASPEP